MPEMQHTAALSLAKDQQSTREYDIYLLPFLPEAYVTSNESFTKLLEDVNWQRA